ncbi:hypothetical protein JA1_003874 [Spathaspora sp. JA1]|nr:hypothetical protein JA1_003874 [Spathaspora sp. JA1]
MPGTYLWRPSSILSLTDEILSLILAHLNQIEVIQVMQTHSRLKKLGEEKLFNSLYIGMDSNPLKVSCDIHTSFYLNFTIINKSQTFLKLYKGMKLDLVRNIVFFSDLYKTSYWGKNLTFVFPQIRVKIENPRNPGNLKYLQTNQIGRIRSFVLDDSRIFQDYSLDNMALIHELVVIDNLVSYRELNIIPRLANLRKLKLHNVLNVVHDLFQSNQFNVLQVEQLSILWSKAIIPSYIKDLENMFNLNNLTTIELHLCSKEELPPTYESDLQRILLQTSNLNQLFLTSRYINFNLLIKTLKPNSLQTLSLGVIPPWPEPKNYPCGIYLNLDMPEVLKSQTGSISKISLWSSLNHSICSSRLDEFDRIYRVYDKRMYLNAYNIAAVRSLLNIGCLMVKQVLLNRVCYFVSKESDSLPPDITCVNIPAGPKKVQLKHFNLADITTS